MKQPTNKTYSAKPTDVVRKWYVIDASQAPMGRVATEVASLLIGKGKPMFTHHVDVGDYVIVINAAELVATGNKMEDKKYYHHSHYPGGLKTTSLKDKLAKDPSSVITRTVRGMLPVNKLRPARLARLKVYAGSEHNHSAQMPEVFTLKSARNTEKEDK